MIIPIPFPTPSANPTISSKIAAVAPTAASESCPRKRPTMMMSAVLYSCWNMLDIIIGIANAIIDCKIGPSVKLIAVFFIRAIILFLKSKVKSRPKV